MVPDTYGVLPIAPLGKLLTPHSLIRNFQPLNFVAFKHVPLSDKTNATELARIYRMSKSWNWTEQAISPTVFEESTEYNVGLDIARRGRQHTLEPLFSGQAMPIDDA